MNGILYRRTSEQRQSITCDIIRMSERKSSGALANQPHASGRKKLKSIAPYAKVSGPIDERGPDDCKVPRELMPNGHDGALGRDFRREIGIGRIHDVVEQFVSRNLARHMVDDADRGEEDRFTHAPSDGCFDSLTGSVH